MSEPETEFRIVTGEHPVANRATKRLAMRRMISPDFRMTVAGRAAL
jgi:hypothetical protein